MFEAVLGGAPRRGRLAGMLLPAAGIARPSHGALVMMSLMSNALIPDDRDWTWVLERPCPECGFESAAFDVANTAAAIRSNAASWAQLLHAERGALTTRRRLDRWSDLEYAAHVRDVFRLYLERLTMMLEQDDPLYPNWDQDATAADDRYNEQDPATVRVELLAAGEVLAAAFEALPVAAWQRVGRRSDGASFTVDSFTKYLIHDPVHHLWDVTEQRAD